MADKYVITGQRQVTVPDGNGRFQNAMEVSFQVVSNGVTGSIDIPLNRYNKTNVQEAIDAYVTNIEEVHNL